MLNTKTKKRKAAVTKKKAPVKRKKRAVKSKPLIEASTLGVASEHLVSHAEELPEVRPVRNPVFEGGEVDLFRRPILSSTISFWMGVGFGVLIIGILLFFVWQLLRVELAEAIMLGFI